MNCNSLKSIATLIILLTINSIALGQPSSSDSVTISRDQQRQCIIWAKENVVKDSIIVAKDSIVSIQRGYIEHSEGVIAEYDLRLKESTKKYEKMRKKRRNALIFGGSTTVIGFFVGFFVKP